MDLKKCACRKNKLNLMLLISLLNGLIYFVKSEYTAVTKCVEVTYWYAVTNRAVYLASYLPLRKGKHQKQKFTADSPFTD